MHEKKKHKVGWITWMFCFKVIITALLLYIELSWDKSTYWSDSAAFIVWWNYAFNFWILCCFLAVLSPPNVQIFSHDLIIYIVTMPMSMSMFSFGITFSPYMARTLKNILYDLLKTLTAECKIEVLKGFMKGTLPVCLIN